MSRPFGLLPLLSSLGLTMVDPVSEANIPVISFKYLKVQVTDLGHTVTLLFVIEDRNLILSYIILSLYTEWP